MTQEEKLNLLTLWFLKDAGESVKSSDEVRALSYAEKWRLFRWLVNIRMPAPVDKAILDVQDDYLKTRIEEDGITDDDALPTMNSCGSQIPHSDQMSLWQGDITRLKVNAIVNAANSQMLGCFVPMHLCIDNCIHTYAGVQLRQACFEQMEMLRKQYGAHYQQPTAIPMITDAYNLPCQKVIHIVGPIVENECTLAHEQKLAECYRNTLEICEEYYIQSVAFCCISTGVFRFPETRAAEIAVKTVSDWLSNHPNTLNRVIFNVFKDKDKRCYEQQF